MSDRGEVLGRVLPVAIGRYVLERVLVDGPSFADYEGRHQTLGHSLTIRHERWPSPQNWQASLPLRPTMDRATVVHALEGLRRSRRLQASLQHPRILPVIDFFEHDGEWFSVFAQIPDVRSLRDIIDSIRERARPPFSIGEFVAISAGVTDALAAIHRAGFVHRTLGTDNILVESAGQVRLSDLGCATPVNADDEPAAAFRWFMRPSSAAPEQIDRAGAFSPAIDNWALGVALFEMRYGCHPYLPDLPSTIDGIQRVLHESIEFPSAVERAEALLQPWLRRLLERDPENRYMDALEAQRDLQAIAAEVEGLQPVARAFVAMPFAVRYDPVWRAIRSACTACRVAVTRVDQSHQHDSIWDEISDAIRSCDFMIAVATPEASGTSNPNVMLEIGYARALMKPVLLLTDTPATLPFDLRTQRALVYAMTTVGGGEFSRELVAFVGGIVERLASATLPAQA